MSQIHRFERTYEGVTFTGSYHYMKGEPYTSTSPGSSSQVFINDIMVAGSDDNLIDVLKPDIIDELERIIADSIDGDY